MRSWLRVLRREKERKPIKRYAEDGLIINNTREEGFAHYVAAVSFKA